MPFAYRANSVNNERADASVCALQQFEASNHMGQLSVTLFFVEMNGASADLEFAACGDRTKVGPFLSASDAVDWKREFHPGGIINSRQSNEDGVCQGPHLSKTIDGWRRI